MSDIDPRIKHVAFGTGHFVVSAGTYQGKPAVYIEPVASPGKIGTLHVNALANEVNDNTIILTFDNLQSYEVVTDKMHRVFKMLIEINKNDTN